MRKSEYETWRARKHRCVDRLTYWSAVAAIEAVLFLCLWSTTSNAQDIYVRDSVTAPFGLWLTIENTDIPQGANWERGETCTTKLGMMTALLLDGDRIYVHYKATEDWSSGYHCPNGVVAFITPQQWHYALRSEQANLEELRDRQEQEYKAKIEEMLRQFEE